MNFRRLGGAFVLLGILHGALRGAEEQASSLADLDAELAAALRRADAAACDRHLADDPNQLNARDKRGWTPLMYAAFYGDESCVRLLLERGADIHAANHAGSTALHYAATSPQKVKLLLDAGADGNVRSKLGNTPLMLACRSSSSSPAVRLLLNSGAEVNARNVFGVSALMIAASTDDVETVKLLLEHAADPSFVPHSNPVDANGRRLDLVFGGLQTAVDWAARTGNLETVGLLLDAGADVNGPSLIGPPLISAAQGNRTAVARLLLERGADVEGTSPMGGWTPLMWAAANEYGDPELVDLLIEHRADVNAQRGAEWAPFMSVPQTALMIALRRGKTEIVNVLREAGAEETDDSWAFKIRTPPERNVSPEYLDAAALAAAIMSAIPLLERTATESFEEFTAHGQNCISCHNQLLPLLAVSLAKKSGIPHSKGAAEAMIRLLEGQLEAGHALNSETTMDPSPSSFNGYLLWGLASESVEHNVYVDAAVHAAAVHQAADGSWRQFVPRPPMTDAEISSTALGIRALTLYPLPGRTTELEARVVRAREWLWKSEPRVTEEHVYKLLGLYWAGEPRKRLMPLAEVLAGLQRGDGGWAQLPGLESDAYATAQTLYALAEAGGADVAGDVMRKGLAYLVRNQLQDGSWFVRRRAYPFQPTMDPVFPHGRDAWISTAATSWAVMALSVALDKQNATPTFPESGLITSQAAGSTATRLPQPADRPVDFERDIAAILENSCLSCHSSAAPAGQYALDTRQALLKGGLSGPPVVIPGDSARSRLIHHVAGLIEDVEMPPPAHRDEYEPLSAEQIGLLRAWIDQGLPGFEE